MAISGNWKARLNEREVDIDPTASEAFGPVEIEAEEEPERSKLQPQKSDLGGDERIEPNQRERSNGFGWSKERGGFDGTETADAPKREQTKRGFAWSKERGGFETVLDRAIDRAVAETLKDDPKAMTAEQREAAKDREQVEAARAKFKHYQAEYREKMPWHEDDPWGEKPQQKPKQRTSLQKMTERALAREAKRLHGLSPQTGQRVYRQIKAALKENQERRASDLSKAQQIAVEEMRRRGQWSKEIKPHTLGKMLELQARAYEQIQSQRLKARTFGRNTPTNEIERQVEKALKEEDKSRSPQQRKGLLSGERAAGLAKVIDKTLFALHLLVKGIDDALVPPGPSRSR